jgi:hypothetical protein
MADEIAWKYALGARVQQPYVTLPGAYMRLTGTIIGKTLMGPENQYTRAYIVLLDNAMPTGETGVLMFEMQCLPYDEKPVRVSRNK